MGRNSLSGRVDLDGTSIWPHERHLRSQDCATDRRCDVYSVSWSRPFEAQLKSSIDGLCGQLLTGLRTRTDDVAVDHLPRMPRSFRRWAFDHGHV